MLSALHDLVASGVSLFNQDARLLELRFPADSGFSEAVLLPHRLSGEEGLSRNYRYELDCLSPDAHLELKELIGQPIEIALLLPEGGSRLLTGLVTAARHQGTDGGFASYRLTVEPALATLAHRRNSRVFQDQSVPRIVQTILDEHLAGNPAFTASFAVSDRLTRDYPARSYTLQYRESDLAFIERLLAEEGISYRYTHGPDPDTSLSTGESAGGDDGSAASDASSSGAEEGDTPILHTLILQDADVTHPAAGESPLRFHRTDGVETADAIDTWEGERRLQSGAVALTTWDYKGSSHFPAGESTRNPGGDTQQGLATTLEDYDPQTGYYGSSPDDVGRYAELRQQAKDLAGKTFTGGGTARHLVPGTWFELQDHPQHDQDDAEDRQFLVTGLSFAAENNLTPEAKSALGGLLGQMGGSGAAALLTGEPGKQGGGSAAASLLGNTPGSQNTPPYRNTFTVVRKNVPVVPQYHQSSHQKPTAHGLTTATVVGPAGEEIFTDEHGRIKIQFHWQRKEDHPNGGADFDDRSSTWVRVAMPSAGATWGTQYIPRIGQEVVIDFIEGDIDRPLVTGVVYNGCHRPPTFSGAGKLPANKTLSGHKSKEYKGSRYNELLFDDSTNEIRTKLSSEHGKTQLNQGFLIHPRTDGKGEPRGEGFELRTDNQGAIRAAQGLLITTEAQANASGKQLAREGAQGQLAAAYELAKSLGEVATRQLADTIEHGPEKVSPDNQKESPTKDGHLKHHLEALTAWEAGSNTDKEGKTATEESGRQPILVLSAPAGIANTTPQNHSTAAGTNIDQVAQRDLNQTAGRRWLANVGQHISLFVNGVKEKISLKLIAAQGKVQVQAQHGEIEVTGERDVNITSTTRKIRFAADQEILLTSGGAYVRIKGGKIELHCPGTLSVKGAKHQWSGPASMNVPMPGFGEGKLAPIGPYTAHYQLFKDDGRPFEGYRYEVTSTGADISRTGKTDTDGFTDFVDSERLIPLAAQKAVMRESERITENWRSKLATVAKASYSSAQGKE
mgnify:CR=1 FL=1